MAAMTPVMAAHAGVQRCQSPAKAAPHDAAEVTVTMIDVVNTIPPPNAQAHIRAFTNFCRILCDWLSYRQLLPVFKRQTWNLTATGIHERAGQEAKLRIVVSIVALIGAAAVAWGAWSFVLRGHGRADYRDPARLAQAVKAREHSFSASCGKLPTGKYFCSVASLDGTSGNYMVTVSPDGSSWSAD